MAKKKKKKVVKKTKPKKGKSVPKKGIKKKAAAKRKVKGAEENKQLSFPIETKEVEDIDNGFVGANEIIDDSFDDISDDDYAETF